VPFYIKNNICLFQSHVPKTGGTSVRKFLESNNGFLMEYNQKITELSQQHRHKDDEELLQEIKKRKPIFSFTVIRHPFDRIFSEFRYGHHWGANKTEADFDYFIEFHFKKFNKSGYDNHLRPQVEYIHDNMKVYKFGNWDKLVEDIDKIIPLDNKKFPKENSAKTYDWLPQNQETIKKIEEVYKEDYELYNSL
jgi:hypothetical protein